MPSKKILALIVSVLAVSGVGTGAYFATAPTNPNSGNTVGDIVVTEPSPTAISNQNLTVENSTIYANNSQIIMPSASPSPIPTPRSPTPTPRQYIIYAQSLTQFTGVPSHYLVGIETNVLTTDQIITMISNALVNYNVTVVVGWHGEDLWNMDLGFNSALNATDFATVNTTLQTIFSP